MAANSSAGWDDPERGGWLTGALDPAANLRSLLDARGAGRQIAEDFAEQLLARGVGRPPGNGDRPPRDGRDGNGNTPGPGSDVDEILRQLRADAARAGDASAGLIEHAFALLTTLVTRIPRPEEQAGTKPLTLGPVTPGEEAVALFWLHNTAGIAVPEVRPHCAALRSHSGRELEPAGVRFDPPVLDPLPPRSSCGIEVRIPVPAAATPGTYASVILASNAPDWYLPISVAVGEAPNPP